MVARFITQAIIAEQFLERTECRIFVGQPEHDQFLEYYLSIVDAIGGAGQVFGDSGFVRIKCPGRKIFTKNNEHSGKISFGKLFSQM